MVDIGDDLLSSAFELALIHGQGIMTSPIAFTLLLDTVFYIFDGKLVFMVSLASSLTEVIEFPPDTRHPPDLFLHCLKIDFLDLTLICLSLIVIL